jgi:hypothetical protein
MTPTRLGAGDRLRIEAALLRVDWVLDGRVPWRVRRQLKGELRTNLLEAAGSVGTQVAIRQLGNLQELGVSYLDVHRGRIDVRRGGWAAVITYASIQLLAVAVFLAFNAGLFAGGGRGGGYEVLPGLGPFAGSVHEGRMAFTFEFLSPAHLALMLIAFVVGSRAWRLLNVGRAPRK